VSTSERGAFRHSPSTGSIVAAAVLLAITLVGCSSGSSDSASRRGQSTTTVPAANASTPAATGPRVIIDTDLSRWWDDATAIGIANVLQQQGAVNVIGIVSDVRNPVAVAAIDAIDTAYGHADLPLGAVAHSGANTATAMFSRGNSRTRSAAATTCQRRSDSTAHCWRGNRTAASRSCPSVRTRTSPDSSRHILGARWSPRRSSAS